MRKNLVVTCLLAVAFFCSATFASAALVTQWSYTNDATFVEWENNVGTQATMSVSADLKKLYWGVPYNGAEQSRMELNAPVSGDDLITGIGDYGPTVPVVSITHFNNRILTSEPYLASGTVEATVQFTPFNPAGPAQPVETAYLTFLFFETPNVLTTADDVFILVDPGLTQGRFDYDGYAYDFKFTSTGFGPLEAAYNDYLNTQLGTTDIQYLGWLTDEDGNTSAQFFLSIKAVPEPGTMLLLGAGLLGLGFTARRNRKN